MNHTGRWHSHLMQKLTARWGAQPKPAHHTITSPAALRQGKAERLPSCQAAGTGSRPEAGHQLMTPFCQHPSDPRVGSHQDLHLGWTGCIFLVHRGRQGWAEHPRAAPARTAALSGSHAAEPSAQTSL